MKQRSKNVNLNIVLLETNNNLRNGKHHDRDDMKT